MVLGFNELDENMEKSTKGCTRDSEEKWAQGMFQDAQRPISWLLSSNRLRRASEVLFEAYHSAFGESGEPLDPENVELDVPASLLYGYAVENALKAIILVELGLPEACTWPKIEGWQQHDLKRLIKNVPKAVSKTITPIQLELLGVLTSMIVWAGKYPVAFKLDEDKRSSFLVPRNANLSLLGAGVRLPASCFQLSRAQIAEMDALLEAIDSYLRPKLFPGVEF